MIKYILLFYYLTTALLPKRCTKRLSQLSQLSQPYIFAQRHDFRAYLNEIAAYLMEIESYLIDFRLRGAGYFSRGAEYLKILKDYFCVRTIRKE